MAGFKNLKMFKSEESQTLVCSNPRMRGMEGGSGSFSPALSFVSPGAFSRHVRLKFSLIRTSFHFSDTTEWPACRRSAIIHAAVHFTREATEARSRAAIP